MNAEQSESQRRVTELVDAAIRSAAETRPIHVEFADGGVWELGTRNSRYDPTRWELSARLFFSPSGPRLVTKVRWSPVVNLLVNFAIIGAAVIVGLVSLIFFAGNAPPNFRSFYAMWVSGPVFAGIVVPALFRIGLKRLYATDRVACEAVAAAAQAALPTI